MPEEIDRIVELDLGFRPEAAVSGGVLVKSDYSTFLTFNAMGRQSDGYYMGIGHAVFEFTHCIRTIFGHPNDEARRGHRLYAKGLNRYGYGIFEIFNSSWIDEIRQENRVAFPDVNQWGESLRHFIFTFHDSTFECVAVDFKVEVVDAPYAQVFARIANRIVNE